MPDPDPGPAVDWLLAEYDGTVNPFVPDPADDPVRGAVLFRGVYVQPMFTLRNPVGSGRPMRVTRADYNDPGRWWL
jgi:hypothetical protein